MGNKNKKNPMTINQKVVTWTQGQLGKQIGKGECWDLAEQALKQAGAQTSNDLGPVDQDSDYIWGDSVAIKDVIPGDILQFRDHEVTTTTETEYTFADGSSETVSETTTAERPHHTAIVNSKLDSDGTVKTLDQHVKPRGKVVQNKKLYTHNVAPVVKKSVERRKNPTTKKMETAKVTRTVTISVTGTIWAYRPKPK